MGGKLKSRSKSKLENKLPVLIYIISYQLEPDQFPTVDETLNRLLDKYKVKDISKEPPITISINSTICKIKKIDEEDSRTYIVSVFSDRKDFEKITELSDLKEVKPHVHRFLNAFPKNPTSTFTIKIGYTTKLKESSKDIEEYLHSYSARAIISAGVIKNNILATLKGKGEDASGHVRNLLLISLEDTVDKANMSMNALIEDLARYASHAGMLTKLFRERMVILKQVESSEKDTQERLQEILGNIRRPPEQVKPGDLGSMLTEVSGIFSRLTTITSSIRRDHIMARSYLQRIRSFVDAWNEKPVMNYSTTSSVEIAQFEWMVNPFSDNVDRLQALRIQLDTALDTIRTYVGIQQHNVNVEEQRDTKKLLSRMVNLQEVLHKLEILIVAFYLTEMGRLVFDIIAHDIVDILTVAFIPAALLIAIGIRKLLHKSD